MTQADGERLIAQLYARYEPQLTALLAQYDVADSNNTHDSTHKLPDVSYVRQRLMCLRAARGTTLPLRSSNDKSDTSSALHLQQASHIDDDTAAAAAANESDRHGDGGDVSDTSRRATMDALHEACVRSMRDAVLYQRSLDKRTTAHGDDGDGDDDDVLRSGGVSGEAFAQQRLRVLRALAARLRAQCEAHNAPSTPM